MKAIVRDDIILLATYVNAEFKYKKYLELIQKAGNYCFLDQFKKLIDGGENIVRNMVENNLIATENLNNSYKYIYLTDTAMKYLELRDSNEDYSDVKKNRISVKKVKKNPTQKQLFSSAFKFHLLVSETGSIDKSMILKEIEDSIYIQVFKANKDKTNKWIKDHEDKIVKIQEVIDKEKNNLCLSQSYFKDIIEESNILSNIEEQSKLSKLIAEDSKISSEIAAIQNKLIKSGLDELKIKLQSGKVEIKLLKEKIEDSQIVVSRHNENIDKIKKQITEYENELKKIYDAISTVKNRIESRIKPKYDESKKIFENLYDISKVIARIKDKTLEFIILDTGNFKTAYGYLKQVNLIKELKLTIEDINIIIYSYAENRADNLFKEFERVKKDKEKALKTMKTYNVKTNNNPKKSDFYIAAEKTYNNTPDFKLEVREDLYYIAKYISAISDLDKSIKLKDKRAIDDLINKLSN